MGANIVPLPGGLASAYTPGGGTPRFGSGSPVIKVRKFLLDTAMPTPVEIPIAGNFVWAFEASDLQAQIQMQFNDTNSDAIDVNSGFGIGGVVFGRLYISWTAQAGKTLTIMYGVLPNITNFFINPANALNSVNVNGVVNVAVAKETKIVSTADVSATTLGNPNLILPINTKRLFAILTLISSNATTLRVGDINVGAAQGLPFGSTGGTVFTTITLQTTAAIYAALTGVAGAAIIAVLEIQDN